MLSAIAIGAVVSGVVNEVTNGPFSLFEAMLIGGLTGWMTGGIGSTFINSSMNTFLKTMTVTLLSFGLGFVSGAGVTLAIGLIKQDHDMLANDIIDGAFLGVASSVSVNLFELSAESLKSAVMRRIDQIRLDPLSYITEFPDAFVGAITYGLSKLCKSDKKERGSDGSWSCSL